MNCKDTLEAIFDLWDTLVIKTNDPSVTDEELNQLWDEYETAMEAMAVANGHPPGRPRRRP